MSAFADVRSLAPQQIWAGVVSRAVHADRVTLTLLELDAAAVVPEHSHANEQVGLLLEGSVTFRIGDETKRLEPGDTWRILGGVSHSVETGPAGAVIVEVFSPVRDDWRGLEEQEPRPPRWPAG